MAIRRGDVPRFSQQEADADPLTDLRTVMLCWWIINQQKYNGTKANIEKCESYIRTKHPFLFQHISHKMIVDVFKEVCI